jgi:epoxyqueuosine reductase
MPALALFPSWFMESIQSRDLRLWGVADLRKLPTPKDGKGQAFPFALSWAVPVNPSIMIGIQQGPTREYANEYDRLNTLINRTGELLAEEIKSRGYRAQPLAASVRTDPVAIKGDFPHKTAATRAGLGWIGRHCQLITRAYGSWVRLGTVFTDLALPPAHPVERSFCGHCRRCVEACPARALKGKTWHPGIPREEMLDARACDEWKKEHYGHFHNGHVCGICSAVCPHSLKVLRKNPPAPVDQPGFK